MSTAERILQKTIKRLTDELGHAEGQVMQERLRANTRVKALWDRLRAASVILSVSEPLDFRSAEDLAKLRMDDIARLTGQVKSLEEQLAQGSADLEQARGRLAQALDRISELLEEIKDLDNQRIAASQLNQTHEERQNRALLVLSGGGPHRAGEAARILRGAS
jgi:uncharacterized protein YhaN